jgi:phosphohistidine swiveling domain-containing protein
MEMNLHMKKIGFVIIGLLMCAVTVSLVSMEDLRQIVAVGNFGCGSNVTGTASIITGYNQISKIRKGDIVVAPSTTSSWDDALRFSAGIITEESGKKCHAALLGKKLGIPVIVGVSDATKKIVDGSFITLDCTKKTIYTANNNCAHKMIEVRNAVLHDDSSNHKIHHHSYVALSGNDILMHVQDAKNGCADFIALSKERFLCDFPVIKKWIMGEMASKLSWGYSTPRWLAKSAGKINDYTYDAIPFKFFDDFKKGYKIRIEKELDHFIERLQEEDIDYIQSLKDDFRKYKLGDEKDINDNDMAKFCHARAIDTITLNDDHRVLLKEKPSEVNKCIEEGIVKKDEWKFRIFLNFVGNWYLKEELKQAKAS